VPVQEMKPIASAPGCMYCQKWICAPTTFLSGSKAGSQEYRPSPPKASGTVSLKAQRAWACNDLFSAILQEAKEVLVRLKSLFPP